MLFPAQRAHGFNPPNPLGPAERVLLKYKRLFTSVHFEKAKNMSEWSIQRVDNLSDAHSLLQKAKRTAEIHCCDSSMPAVVYIAEKENCALIIEAPDIAVPPEITEAFQAVWVGTASQIIRLNQTLTQRNILPIQSPLVHFIVVPARSMIIAACETDAYFIRADGFLLKHEPFHDLLSSCVIQSESLICDFFEGTQAVFDLPEPLFTIDIF